MMNLLALLLVGSAAAAAVAANGELVLLDPSAPIDELWSRGGWRRQTEYSRSEASGVPAIRAVGRNSGSALHRELRYRPADYPWLEWSWRVDKLQESADIRDAKREDFGAAVSLIFGRPSLLRRNVPTLSYVWTSTKLRAGDVVASPHHQGTTQSVVLQAGPEKLGQWIRERRNVLDDYRRAFGADPPEHVEVIALWTDNDQTGEPVEAYYGRIAARSR